MSKNSLFNKTKYSTKNDIHYLVKYRNILNTNLAKMLLIDETRESFEIDSKKIQFHEFSVHLPFCKMMKCDKKGKILGLVILNEYFHESE